MGVPSDQPLLPFAAGRRLNKMMSVQLVRLSAATAAGNDDTVQVRAKMAVVAPWEGLTFTRGYLHQGLACFPVRGVVA